LKETLGGLKCRREDSIKIYLRGLGGMGCIDLFQDWDQTRALVNTVTILRIPRNVRKFLSSAVAGGFSRRAQLHGLSYVFSQPFHGIVG
jgi:hypothetical protein